MAFDRGFARGNDQGSVEALERRNPNRRKRAMEAYIARRHSDIKQIL
jgi:hypothetical protein